MKPQFVNDFTAERQTVDTILAVQSAELRDFSSKPGQFLSLRLRDKTGAIDGKMWQPDPAVVDKLTPGVVVRVTGSLSRWRDRMDLVVETLSLVEVGGFVPEDFVATCARPISDMWEELQTYVKLVDDPDLQRLLEAFGADDDLKDSFCRAPASRGWHHGYLGGLLEHTLSVTRLCTEAAAGFPEASQSMVITGAVMHDLGKIDDYQCTTVIEHTLSGRLLGHIVTGYTRLLALATAVPGFPEEKLLRLAHIVISHHRREEWGSPQRPKTIEAQIVHYADNFDAQVNGFSGARKMGSEQGKTWFYHRLLETDILCEG